MLDLEYKMIAPDTYVKWNAVLGIRTTLWFHGVGKERKITVRHDQPKALIANILDHNIQLQNSFRGYKGREMVQATSMPIAIHEQIKKKCGFKPGQGYDHKKFRQIVNDRDNYKLKSVPGNI